MHYFLYPEINMKGPGEIKVWAIFFLFSLGLDAIVYLFRDFAEFGYIQLSSLIFRLTKSEGKFGATILNLERMQFL